MIMPRETLYAALFAQWQGQLTASFKTMSRRWKPPDQVSPADLPAMFQVEREETAARPEVNGLPTKWHTGIDLVLYTSGSTDPGTIPSIELNGLMDAVENSLKAVTPGLSQKLGLTIIYCRIEGKIDIVENVQGAIAMGVIPISLEILG